MVDIGLFSRRKQRQEIRAEPVILTLEGLLGSTDKVTREQAMEIPTVSACISKISEEVGKLPVRLYRREGDQVTEITEDSRLKLLNGETGDMNPNVADVNNDGSIDVTDAVEILNIYLNNQ